MLLTLLLLLGRLRDEPLAELRRRAGEMRQGCVVIICYRIIVMNRIYLRSQVC